jgi:hypothetical protein
MIYISGRISDHNPEVVQARLALFDDAQATLEAAGYVTFNPAALSRTNPDWTYAQYMHQDLTALLRSDGVAILPGWTYSAGATLEVQIANVCHIPVHGVEVWTTYAAAHKVRGAWE